MLIYINKKNPIKHLDVYTSFYFISHSENPFKVYAIA